jgi:hypothetical protein
MLPIATPSSVQTSCLDYPALSPAWSCDIPLSSIRMTVSPIIGSTSQTSCNKIALGQNNVPAVFYYGNQPPVIETEQVLSLVSDKEHSQLGPAWYFQTPYNKLVIAPETSFTPPSIDTRSKSSGGSSDSTDYKGAVQAGAKPWFCYWNGTTRETFIYVNMTSPSGAQQASASASMVTAYSAATVISARSMAAIPTPTPTSQYKSPVALEGYPKLIKVEERRNPSESHYALPYCVQMSIKSDGSAEVILDRNKQPTTIWLNETEPAVSVPGWRRGIKAELVERQSNRACHCAWFST